MVGDSNEGIDADMDEYIDEDIDKNADGDIDKDMDEGICEYLGVVGVAGKDGDLIAGFLLRTGGLSFSSAISSCSEKMTRSRSSNLLLFFLW